MLRFIAFFALIAIELLSSASASLTRPRTQPPAKSALDPELRKAWQTFAQAVRRNDQATLRKLSASCIKCTDCLRNTAVEEKAFDKYMDQHPDTGYDRLFGPMSFIPTETFWRQDAHLVFDAKTKGRMLNSAKLAFIASDHNKAGYVSPCLILPTQVATAHLNEVLLTYMDPSNESEGMQQAFAFVKTKQGYKFCGYSTIP